MQQVETMSPDEVRAELKRFYATGKRNWLDSCLRSLPNQVIKFHKETIRDFCKKDLDMDCADASQVITSLSKRYFFLGKKAMI